jgi:hypothetical protein
MVIFHSYVSLPEGKGNGIQYVIDLFNRTWGFTTSKSGGNLGPKPQLALKQPGTSHQKIASLGLYIMCGQTQLHPLDHSNVLSNLSPFMKQ